MPNAMPLSSLTIPDNAPVRLGVIGCGAVASYGHFPAVLRNPRIQLKSVLDVDTVRLMETRQRFNVPNTFTDLEEFFASGIDAVAVCSPAPNHREHVLAAARFGKPTLCEKPLAMDETEATEMIDAMSAANLPLFVGFTYRFSPVALDIHRLVRDNAIGKVRSLRLAYLWDCHGKYEDRGLQTKLYDRRHGRMLEGGPMVDCGVHQIDLARWWTGSEVKSVTGAGAWVETENYAAPDHVYLHMDHADGCHSMIEMSFTYGHTARDPRCDFVYELIGTDGLIRYDRQQRLFEVVNKHGTQWLNWTEEKNFDGMYHAFEQAVRTGVAGNMPTAQDGQEATRLARLGTEDAMLRRAG